MKRSTRLISGIAVLVVDDERDARKSRDHAARGGRAKWHVAGSAAEGARPLQRRSFYALISDIGMPDVDGFAFLQQVRALPAQAGGKIPAIALTAFARAEDQQRALACGFDLFLSKPVEPTELIAAVARCVSRTEDPPVAIPTLDA